MSDAMSTTAPSWVLGRLQSMGTRTYQFARTTPAGAFGAVLVLAMAVLAVFGPLIQPYGPLDTNFNDLFRSPSGDFLLGTDYPYDMGESDPLGLLERAGLGASDAVCGGNAARLLGLSADSGP